MNFKDLCKTAISSITSNKLQAFLSMLGVIIGISSVVTIMTISEGARQSIQMQVADMGTNMISASVFDYSEKGINLTTDDIYPLSNSPYIDYVTVETRSSNVNIKYNDVEFSAYPMGVDEFYLDYKDLSINGGRFINSADNMIERKVVVLGSQAAIDLFGQGVNPVGEYITIESYDWRTEEQSVHNFQVIGVLDYKLQSGYTDYNSNVYMPHSVVSSVYNEPLSNFFIIAKDTDSIKQAEADAEIYIQGLIYPYIVDEYNNEQGGGFNPGWPQIGEYDEEVQYDTKISIGGMGGYYGSNNPVTDYYYLYNTGDFIEQAMTMINTITLLIAAIAAISLVVGGIGIANVMFMAVMERTKEIGLRKAVGARNVDIILQFLIESVLVTCVGGSIGLLLGAGISTVISSLVPELPTVFSPTVMLGTFAVSAATGVLAGFFPARKASKLNPIDALRYE